MNDPKLEPIEDKPGLTTKQYNIFASALDNAQKHGAAYVFPRSEDDPIVIISFQKDLKRKLEVEFDKNGIDVSWPRESD